MSRHYIEHSSFGRSPSVKDLTRHMYTRCQVGKILIITDKPKTIEKAFKKQWLKLMRKVQATLKKSSDSKYISELSRIIAHMQLLKIAPDVSLAQPDIYILTPQQALGMPPLFKTIYLTQNANLDYSQQLESLLLGQGVIVDIPIR